MPLIRKLLVMAPSFCTEMPLPTAEPEPALPGVPIVSFCIVTFALPLNGALPFWKALIATARENWKLLFEMLNLRFVAMASEETSTPTLLFENVAPDTLAACAVP